MKLNDAEKKMIHVIEDFSFEDLGLLFFVVGENTKGLIEINKNQVNKNEFKAFKQGCIYSYKMLVDLPNKTDNQKLIRKYHKSIKQEIKIMQEFL